jgi:hypothetical protein
MRWIWTSALALEHSSAIVKRAFDLDMSTNIISGFGRSALHTIDTPVMTSILTPRHIHSSELSNDVQIPDSPLQPPPKPKVASLCLKRRKEALEMENAIMTAI